MADADHISDEYVARLLVKDAENSAIKYSALGMEAFYSSKPATNKPKPNIRFLRTIIKETDSHNAALLAKEASESKARLASLVTKDAHTDADIRRRQLGHITAHLTGRPPKRRRTESESDEFGSNVRRQVSSRRREVTLGSGERYHDGRKEGRDDEDKGIPQSGGRERRRSHSVGRSGKTDKRREHRSSRRPHFQSHGESQDKELKYRKGSRDRKSNRSPCAESTDDDERQNRNSTKRQRSSAYDSSGLTKERKSGKEKAHECNKNVSNEDSDPLDDFIGPRPPPVTEVRTRGRGTISAASGIDARFSSSYDPTIDIQLDPDEENCWDQALEAFRDRQKWKQQGADRLRAVGFTEEEIEKWEKGSKKENDVRWAKKGESREWDRGKAVESDDVHATESVIKADLSWGRLKST